MSSQYGEAVTRLPIPDSNCLIIGTTQYPRQVIGVKLDCSNIVQMPAQRIQYILEVPYFYFVIVAAAGEHASRRMKINGTHWSIMLFKSIKQRANSVIPKLDCTTDCYQCLELIGIVDRGAITCADCKEAKVVLDGRKRPSRDSTSTQTLSASQQPWPIQRMQQRRRTQLVGLLRL